MFLDSMKKKVRGKGMRVVYAEGNEERAIRAAALLRDEDLAKPILIGDTEKIEKLAKKLRIDSNGIDIHDRSEDKDFEKYVDKYYELRKHKEITRKQAEDKVKQPHYFGALMVHLGKADGMVSGLNSETKPFIPAFEIIGLKKGFRRASSLFVLEWPERLLFFADCSVNIDPDAKTLSDIAHATAQTVASLGYEPRVAFLSFSTCDSAKGESVDKVKEALRLTKKECPDMIVDGEIQFDAALLPDIAKKKAPGSVFEEKGANVFIFPDLNSGNIAYKISERLGRATATGPILQGLNHPINDVSRGCSFEDFANSGVLTAALAMIQNQKGDECQISEES
jgi:phosphate acetyltransferase